jgi:D-amino-acid dehydrogenase
MTQPSHVVVIGGGIVGAAVGLHALRCGCRVTILDPYPAGSPEASSFGNAGWLSSHSIIPPATPGVWKKVPKWLFDPLGPLTIRWPYLPKAAPWLLRYLSAARTYPQIEKTAHALRALLYNAPDLHIDMARTAGVPHLIQKRGLLHVYPTLQDCAQDDRLWQIRANEGVTWEDIPEAVLRRDEPHLDHRYQVGRYVPDVGNCTNPGEYVKAVIRHVVASGGAVRAGRATGFRIADRRLTAVTTTEGEIACDKAVIAAGAQAKQLAWSVGDRISLETERGYHASVQTASIGPITPTMFMDQKVIVTRMETGLRIAGQVEIAAFADSPNWKRAEILKDLLVKIYPTLSNTLSADKITVWMGRRPSTPDGLPCIGPARHSPDVIHAYGHGHVGLAGSARTGQLVAALLTGQPTAMDLSPYSPQRF